MGYIDEFVNENIRHNPHALTQTLWYLCLVIGSIKSAFLIYEIFAFIVRHFFRRPYNFRERYGAGPNTWALVTGSSDGIGAEYAK